MRAAGPPLLEDVDGYEVAEADIVKRGGVVEVAGRALGEGDESFLAAPVVPEARKVQLNVLEATRSIRFEPFDRLPEDPQHKVIDTW